MDWPAEETEAATQGSALANEFELAAASTEQRLKITALDNERECLPRLNQERGERFQAFVDDQQSLRLRAGATKTQQCWTAFDGLEHGSGQVGFAGERQLVLLLGLVDTIVTSAVQHQQAIQRETE